MSKVSRREFIGRGACVLGGAALCATVVAVARARSRRNARQENPIASKKSHMAITDPKWLHYEEVRRFRCPRVDARRISSGPDDLLYLAAGKYITVLDRNGELVHEFALHDVARCVTVAKDGVIYAASRGQIEVFDGKGRPARAWEVAPDKTWFTGLTVGDNDLFAADAGNRAVQRYDRSGKLLGQIGNRNKERAIPGFSVPSPFFDLELASDGLLRVTNPGRHQVQVFTAAGDLEFSFGETSAQVEGFCGCCNPVGVTMLSDGRYVTCEKGSPRVKIYAPSGKLESVVAGSESFTESRIAEEDADWRKGRLDAAVDSAGRIYILDLVTNEIRVMQRKGSDA